MREGYDGSSVNSDSVDGEETKKRKKPKKKSRKTGGFGRAQGFAQGLGGMFGGGFGPGQLMQLLPLIMAMGRGMPGAGMAGLQLQLMMWVVETWLDYLTALHEVFERALDRLREMDAFAGLLAGAEDDDDGEEW